MIQIPCTRNDFYEWLDIQHLHERNLLAPRYGLVRACLNGRSRGIYAFEEPAAIEEARMEFHDVGGRDEVH